jgi:hypothetical protein
LDPTKGINNSGKASTWLVKMPIWPRLKMRGKKIRENHGP